MREQLKMGFAKPEQAAEVGEWLQATKGNLFDKSILSYPSLRVLCSYNGIGTCAYLPMQQALVLESLAVKPGLEPMLAGQAFRDLVKGAELVASQARLNEMYFVCSDPEVVKVAANHGFEVLGDKQEDGSIKPWPTLRIKLS